jgi:outer membrane protein
VTSDVARSKARAQAVTSTRSALEAAEVGYDVGTRNVVDVLNAQQAFFSAVRDYENSIIDYVIDLAQLKRLAGTLSPEDIYDLNQWLEAPPDPSASGADSEAATLLNRGTTP